MYDRTIFAVLLMLIGAPGGASLAAAGQQPHLVVFISDDHGWHDWSLGGAPGFHTPHLERVARDGMMFTQAFAPSPTCAPSRAALLTGLMPARNGAMLNHQPPLSDVKKLPGALQELGYEVAAFGKVAHYGQGKEYGFDRVSHDTFHDQRCIPAALDFLERRRSNMPLCLFVGTNWPHVPWPEASADVEPTTLVPPPTHIDTPETRAWRARYAAAVERFDEDLGKVYDAALARFGPNVLFIHFSDHGAQWPFGKWNLYDAGIRVPLIVVWPGVVERGSQSEAMVSLVDVFATLIGAAGGEPPADIDGRSFIEVLRGDRQEHHERIMTTHSGDGAMNSYPMRSIRTRKWKYIRNLRPGAEHHTHIDRGKAVDGSHYWASWEAKSQQVPGAAAIVQRYYVRPAEELYDVEDDPHEQQNLASDPRHAGILAQLRMELDEWMRLQGDEGLATERKAIREFLRKSPEY